MSKTRVIEYQDDELNVRLVVARANMQAGMCRTRLQLLAESADDDNEDIKLLRRFSYPDVIAATVDVEGIPWPLSFEDYVQLPERLGLLWERAVYDLNPSWLPGWEERAEAEKKVMSSTAG